MELPHVNALSEDPKHATRVLSGLANLTQWQVASNMLRHMHICRKTVNKFHLGSVLNACQKATQWQCATYLLWSSFQSVHPGTGSSNMESTVSCSSVLSSCGTASRWKDTLSLLDFMQEKRCEPNLVTLNSVLSSGVKDSLWRGVLAVLGVFAGPSCADAQRCPTGRPFLQPDIVSLNALMSSCEKAGEWQVALNIVGWECQSKMISASRISFSAAVSACEKAEQWHWAVEIFGAADQAEFSGNGLKCIHLHCFNALASACGKGRKWKPATALMDKLALYMVEPDTITFNALLYSCEPQQWKIALGLLRLMTCRELEKNDITFNAACAASRYNWLAVLSLLHAMQSAEIQADALTQSSLVAACVAAREQPGVAARAGAVLKDIATSWIIRVRPGPQHSSGESHNSFCRNKK